MKTKKILLLVLMATCSQFMAHAQNEVVIQYNGSTASVSIPDEIRSEVTASVTGADVVINSATTATEYTYKVKGKSTDGSLTLFGSYKLTLVLAGIELTNAHDGPAINIQCGKRIDVKLMDGTVNTLADAAGGTQKAAFYFTGHVEFGGAGVLNVTGRTKHAISAKEEMKLKSSLGTINVLGAVSDGLHCGKGKVRNEHNYFLMKGGIVNIAQVGSDGVSSDDYGTIKIRFVEEDTWIRISDYHLDDDRFYGVLDDNGRRVDFELYHTSSPNWSGYRWGYDAWYGYYAPARRSAASDSTATEKPVRFVRSSDAETATE